MDKNTNLNLMGTIEKPIGRVAVKLQHNKFSKSSNDKYYGRTIRNTHTVGNILQLVAEKVPQLDIGTVYSVCDALEKVMMESLASGNSAECLRLGVFYISCKGTTDGVSSMPNVTVGFTPGDLLKSAVANVTIEQLGYEKPRVLINEIKDIDTGATDGTITQKCSVRIRGKKLLVGGDGSGLWFAPATGDEATIDETGANWKKVTILAENKPGTLLFAIPKDITAGKYRLIHKTKCIHTLNFERKELITTVSEAIEVK